ncbi:MAG: CocE/NonD family hydrolase [Actinobacteria bacterium]|nr:CocE/NonD family hydrolase [Actinomycetota bacterium]
MGTRRRGLATIAVLTVVAAAAAASPVAADHHQTTSGQSQPIYGSSVVEQYRVPTEHGTIYGVVERPVVPADVKVPVILTYSPYNLTATPIGTEVRFGDGVASYYVPRGYARAIFDLVGTKDSGGCYDFGGKKEGETGAAVVDFLGRQAWSNGKVGMIGGSYDGTTQYATAIEAPEHLTTIVPQVAIDRWYDYPYEHGVRRFSGFGTPLLFDYGYATAPPLNVADDPVAWAEATIGHVNPCSRVEHQIRGYGYDPVYDDFWLERDYRQHARNVTASVLIEGGWRDINVQPVGSTRFWQALPDDHPKKLVIGQWGHNAADFDDSDDIRHAWFDHWLLGLDTGVMELPRVDSGLRGGERIQADHWPPLRTRNAPLGLTGAAAQEVDELGQVLASTTWTDADTQLSEARLLRDCRPSRTSLPAEYVCTQFLGEPLEASVRISGTPLLDLEVVSEAPGGLEEVATQLAVVLFEQYPDGQRIAITRGMLNILNRDGLDTSVPAVSGEPYRATVELDDTEWRVPAGARLGLAIGSHNRNVAFVPDDDTYATNAIAVAGADATPSVLRLPVSEGHTAVGIPDPDDEESGGATGPSAEARTTALEVERSERRGGVLP